MTQPEHRIQDAIMRYLSVVEQLEPTAFFCRTNTAHGLLMGWDRDPNKAHGFKTGRPGWPDITGQFKGKPCYIEVKTDSGRLSDDQQKVHQRLRNGGALVIVARSVEDVEKHLIMRKKVADEESYDYAKIPF